MNELDKLREEILSQQEQRNDDHQKVPIRMSEIRADFHALMHLAREIERQAGIGEEK